jgi:hypothetical protein
MSYEVPDVQPSSITGLSTWPILRDGVEIGRVVEGVTWYVGYPKGLPARRFSFRQDAIEYVTQGA